MLPVPAPTVWEPTEIFMKKSYFKFDAAHFIAHKGSRESLHGHNYTAAVRMRGAVGDNGYLMDFRGVKEAMRSLCKDLDHKFLCPVLSPHHKVTVAEGQVTIQMVDSTAMFSLPESDCAMLPLRHSSVEELSQYLCEGLVRGLTEDALRLHGVSHVWVTVAETTDQEATAGIALTRMHEDAK